jgi:hypothetical protein
MRLHTYQFDIEIAHQNGGGVIKLVKPGQAARTAVAMRKADKRESSVAENP